MNMKDELLKSANEFKNNIDSSKAEDFINKYKKSNAARQQEEIDAHNFTRDKQLEDTKNRYDQQIKKTNRSYDSEYQKNAVQKLINERVIAEKNANLGLTDSGLNRTQQTAVQTSYANQKGAIDIARQGALDELALNLNSAINAIESDRINGNLEIAKYWDAYNTDLGLNEYQTDVNKNVSMYANDMQNATTLQAQEMQAKSNKEIADAQIRSNELLAEKEAARDQANWDKSFAFQQSEAARDQANTDRSFNESQRQYNESLAFDKSEAARAQANADRSFKESQRQFNEGLAFDKSQAAKVTSSKSSSSSSSAKTNNEKQGNNSSKNNSIEKAKKTILDKLDFIQNSALTRGSRGNTGNGGYKMNGVLYECYEDYVDKQLRKLYEKGNINESELVQLLGDYGVLEWKSR